MQGGLALTLSLDSSSDDVLAYALDGQHSPGPCFQERSAERGLAGAAKQREGSLKTTASGSSLHFGQVY